MARVTALAVSGTGLYTPPQSISNEELVTAFNAYVRKTNAANADAIAAGTATALVESSAEFIVKASGIKSRYVVDKAGVLDPDSHVPALARAAQRPDLDPGRDGGDRGARRAQGRRPHVRPTSTASSSALPTCSAPIPPWRSKCRTRSASTASAST